MPEPLFAPHLLSVPGDAAERAADARVSSGAGLGVAVGTRDVAPAAALPAGTPAPVAARAGHARPLAPGLAAEYGQRLGADLRDVRIHTDAAAAELAGQAGARAFTTGSHIFFAHGEFSPQTPGGQALLEHELGHVLAPPPGPARLLRAPTTPTNTTTPTTKDPSAERWIRLQVEASGMDDAAQKLAKVGANDGPNYVYIGLSASFAKAYDTQGRPLGPRVAMKEATEAKPRASFVPGVYLMQPDGSLAAIELEANTGRQRFDVDDKGHGRSVVATRPLTKEEQEAATKEKEAAEKAGRPAKPTQVQGPLDLMKELTDPAALISQVMSVPKPVVIYFVPKIVSVGGGKGGGEKATIYASPIAGRGDGKPANAPPWPVGIEGPKLAPTDSSPTFSAKVDWSANGNWSWQSQAITQVGESIHYQWDYFDITSYARKQIAKDPAHTKDPHGSAPGEGRTLDQNIADFTSAKRGAGTDVTGTAAARREFRREFEDWWKDNRRAARDAGDPHGETSAERLLNAQANVLTLELAPVSFLITAVGAIAHFIADLFSGPRQQQEVNLPKDGIFLIRVITTPAVHEDKDGKEIIRPPSVAGHVVEVMPMERAVQESLDDPAAQLAVLRADIALAEKSGNKAKAEYLRDLLKRAEEQYTASPVTLLSRRLAEKEAELAKFRTDYPTLSAYSKEREVDTLKEQIALYEANEKDRLASFEPGVVPQAMTRVNATLISEVSAQAYPLMMTAGPMGGTGGKHRWMINDVTQLDTGGQYVGELRDTPSEAFHSALEAFGRKAAYGRGTVGARTAGLPGMEAGAKLEFLVESAPADTALALKRIDDLVMTLAAVGLFVASAGTASALIGAAAAAIRLIQRWKAHKLSLNAETVGDILGILGGLGAGAGLVANLRVERMGRAFTILEEGGASPAQLARAAEAVKGAQGLLKAAELANEAIGYAGLLWGDIQFADQILAINAAENDPNSGMTHAAARRARADALNAAIQNNGLFLAGNMLKYRAEAKAASKAVNEEGAAARTSEPTRVPDRPAGTEEQTGTDKPVPEKQPAEKQPAEKQPAEKRPAENEPAGEQGQLHEKSAGADRRPTAKELVDALPPDLRSMAVVDDTLHGDSVRVEWTPDKSGLVGEITIRISAEALPRTVQLHEATVRTMQKYQGLLGQVRRALGRLSNMLGGNALDPGNKPLFDARLEIAKLPKLINEHMVAMESMQGNAREDAEAKLDSLRAQLDEHLGRIEIGELTPSSGVSARGVAKRNQAKYRQLLERLRQLTPGEAEHMETRWEMYQLDNGEMPRASWERVYRSNVERANVANEIVAAERARLGWPEKEHTVKLGGDEVRRLDLADPEKLRGAEVKAYDEGTVYLSKDIDSEVQRDRRLVRRHDWELTWIFIDCKPSGPLRAELLSAGIIIELRTSSQRSSRLSERILPPARKK
ncbi:DUF4157 domain-containing protein [Actinopolymorpha sp. NPDC004070]|uniref:eCIS core domain-containing protein n=1 Tax=Actinopolymorpha sp. NPDC004070 TaxID=3154548 RepID=UPI0033A178D1